MRVGGTSEDITRNDDRHRVGTMQEELKGQILTNSLINPKDFLLERALLGTCKFAALQGQENRIISRNPIIFLE